MFVKLILTRLPDIGIIFKGSDEKDEIEKQSSVLPRADIFVFISPDFSVPAILILINSGGFHMKTTLLKRAAALGLSAIMGMAMLSGCASKTASDTQSPSSETEESYSIGVMQYADHPSLDNCKIGFIKGLEEEGIVEGKNLKLTASSAQGDDALNTQIAQNFVNSGVDLVCGIATPSAMAAYNACYESGIPVVFNAVSDPVAAGLAVSETEPMDGITGVSDQLPVEEQLKMIRSILPEATKIGIIYTTSEVNSVSTIETYKQLAPDYGFEIIERGVGNAAEISQALDGILGDVDCISNMTDNTVVNNLPLELEKASAANKPVFGSEEEQVVNGCLASAGIDYIELGKKAGIMAAKILRGEDIANIPYETMENSKLTINTTVADQLGITIADDILNSAELTE